MSTPNTQILVSIHHSHKEKWLVSKLGQGECESGLKHLTRQTRERSKDDGTWEEETGATLKKFPLVTSGTI